MSKLKVYKASAGSGKTFRLAIEYMKIALLNDSNYKHILAVTFTNKATAEMKSRIIGELHRLAIGEQTAYLDILVKELNWTKEKVQKRAQKTIKHILHDYSRFTISTIDSFFQRVIKAFNRELGINAAYNVELDEDTIMNEAVDRMIQSLGDDPKLLNWLIDFTSQRMTEGKGWDIKKDIKILGKEIFNETFKSLDEELYEKLNDHAFLRTYQQKLMQIITSFEDTLKTIGQQGEDAIMEEDVSVDNFKSKYSGPAGGFSKMKKLSFVLNQTTRNSVSDSKAWVVKPKGAIDPLNSRLEAIACDKLMPLMQSAVQFYQEHSRNYNSAKLIMSQLYTLGILVDLRKAVKEICREKGVILLSDSGHLLRTVIGDAEAPFVYEKTGSVYSHFMIDEFQDTSGLQWNNFKPLIANSLSENNTGMVVGDVKQAIYRWRSGDWRLLANQLKESFPAFGIQNEVMNSNWRSYGQIIRFNNTLFQAIPELLQANFAQKLSEIELTEYPFNLTIPDVYADCIQQISKKEHIEDGYVRVKFLDREAKTKSNNEQLIFSELVSSVKMLQDKGVKPGSMAILVRTKKEAALIADLFLQQKSLPENCDYNFDILSGESLHIQNSEIVAFIISVLNGFLDQENQVVELEISYLYYQLILPLLVELNCVPCFSAQLPTDKENINSTDAFFKDSQPTDLSNGFFSYLSSTTNELIRYLSGKDFRTSIAGKSIPEMIYNICSQFNLFSLPEELAYLQAFVDQVSGYERNQGSELTGFLEWWNQNAGNFTIPISSSVNAITVMTIHKSKGLEFDHVFVPFLDWKIEPQSMPDRAPLLWCRTDIEPFNEIGLLPIRFKGDVGKSIFYNEYATEIFNSYIDNINLMYVTFTRAKVSLWIWAESEDNKLIATGDLLRMSIQNASRNNFAGLNNDNAVSFNNHFNAEFKLLEIGSLTNYTEKLNIVENQSKDVEISEFRFTDFRKFLKIRTQSTDFFRKEGHRQVSINKGKLIHEILSYIDITQDLDKAIKKLEIEGKLNRSETGKIKSELGEMLNSEDVRSWFDGTYRVVNERNILIGGAVIKRPDRIMIGKDEVVVVDYKSGDAELDKYTYQLRSYIRELKSCGYAIVRGYIWYTKKNKRVEIQLN